MKKTVKKSGKNEKTYSADHVSVMLENIHDAVMALGEGQEVLSDKVDKMQGDILRLQDDVTDIKYKLSDKVERSEFEKLEKRVIKVERAVLTRKP